MAKPVGTTVRNKDNSKKHPHVREEWTKGKKIGRPKQVFNADTKTWSKVK